MHRVRQADSCTLDLEQQLGRLALPSFLQACSGMQSAGIGADPQSIGAGLDEVLARQKPCFSCSHLFQIVISGCDILI